MDVKTVAKEHGVTLTEVAQRMGISRVTLMQNLQRNPTLSTMERMAAAIGCDVADFFRTTDRDAVITCPHCGKPIKLTAEQQEEA